MLCQICSRFFGEVFGYLEKGHIFAPEYPQEHRDAMILFQNPVIWFRRVRHRKGYGVHSPFAFNFVTGVLYNKDMYYAYEPMERDLRWWQKGRVRSLRRLAFRLSDYRRPGTLYCHGIDAKLADACRYGCRGLRILSGGSVETADMIFVSGADECALLHVGEGSMIVVKDVHRCRSFWRRIMEDERITVTFDLYDVGIAFARRDLNKQHYIINW